MGINKRKSKHKKHSQRMNNKKPDTQKGLEETAREMADAIYEIMGTGDVLVSESRQKEVTKVLSNYYNLECTAP